MGLVANGGQMNQAEFAQEVDQFLRENRCPAPISAKSAIMTVYDYIANCANAALAHGPDMTEWNEQLFKIQQAMTWSPLRFFWRQLTFDDLLPIRAAAKGNLCEAHGQFMGDAEVGVITSANLPISLDLEWSKRLLNEVSRHPRMVQAVAEWGLSVPQIPFTPALWGVLHRVPFGESI